MRAILLSLLLAMALLAGCTEADPTVTDSDGDGVVDADEEAAGTDPNDPASKPAPPKPDIETEFSFGPGLGCTGGVDGVACVSFELGPDQAPSEVADGYWIPLGPDYTGVAFTGTVGNARGDSDCVFTDADLEIIGEAHNGEFVCQGKVPSNAAYLFVFSYAEPHTGLTVTFTP